MELREPDVVVVIGAGEMGLAITRRIGTGVRVLLADRDRPLVEDRVAELERSGFDAEAVEVDVSSADSVTALASRAVRAGSVRHLVHTAGVSPVQTDVATILAVDLLGTALVLEAFGAVIARGGSAVAIASMAAALYPPLPAAVYRSVATVPPAELLGLPELQAERFPDPGQAYAFAKQANIARVAAQSKSWGARGARVNSISPGVIATAMGRAELAGENGAVMTELIAASGTGRVGTPEDVADAAAYLLGPGAGFVTGVDLIVDGGVTAAVRTG